ncbi:DUF3168 domain-containing protein [Sphingomonas sp. ID1715]|uniref:tail completion protein gp17 n=1 Tax=Sphingomonas sp. ID1715 TaxID=1656898 RepID=UPI0014896F68|nr:DUF3168 domain-containing protein [Sphingomonas sp. ID1715]NNM76651.1 DUF3168 domain-containing protein [Sphingomonas sp. ID1715]
MSFETALQEAVLVALREVPGTNGVFLERPARASVPYLVLAEMLSADWGAKGIAGREVRLSVRVHDAGESWTRTAALQGEVARALEALPRTIGGWSVGTVMLVRARTARGAGGQWVGTVEFRIRAMEA